MQKPSADGSISSSKNDLLARHFRESAQQGYLAYPKGQLEKDKNVQGFVGPEIVRNSFSSVGPDIVENCQQVGHQFQGGKHYSNSLKNVENGENLSLHDVDYQVTSKHSDFFELTNSKERNSANEEVLHQEQNLPGFSAMKNSSASGTLTNFFTATCFVLALLYFLNSCTVKPMAKSSHTACPDRH